MLVINPALMPVLNASDTSAPVSTALMDTSEEALGLRLVLLNSQEEKMTSIIIERLICFMISYLKSNIQCNAYAMRIGCCPEIDAGKIRQPIAGAQVRIAAGIIGAQ